jgi:hypothetical protein
VVICQVSRRTAGLRRVLRRNTAIRRELQERGHEVMMQAPLPGMARLTTVAVLQ